MSAPYISIPEGLPGIRGPLSLRPDVAQPLSELAEVLMRDEHVLTRGERELIGGYVSHLNNCHFCEMAHSTVAQHYLQCSMEFIEAVKSDFEQADLSDKLKAFLAIARSVATGGKQVTEAQVQKAKSLGATDREVHDVVLIAAMFCMFNRYTDGLNTWAPTEISFYTNRAPAIAEKGYTP